MDSNHRSLVGTGRRSSTGKRCQCEVAHTSLQLAGLQLAPPGAELGRIEWWSDYAGGRFMQKEHAAGRTRPPCAGHPPRARADRTTDCARTGSMLPGSGKTFINAALAYAAKDRRIAPLRGLGGRHFDRRDQLRDYRCNRPEDRVERHTALWRRSRGGNCPGSWRSRRGGHGTT